MDNGQSRSLNVLMSISVSLNKEQSTPLATFAVATTRGWETRAGSSLSLLTHAIQMSTYRKRSLCYSLNLSLISLNSRSSRAMRTICHVAKNFLDCSPGFGTAFRLSSWRNIIFDWETRYNGKAKWGLFHAFFFLTVGFSFIGAFWIHLRLFPTLLV